MLYAVIGIGSNSTRLLLGRVENGEVVPGKRLREGTRLFAGLQDGALSEESMMRTAMAAAHFVQLAKKEGAEEIRIIATSAARDAANGEAFCQMVEELCGTPPRIITGEEEARLSFLGSAGMGYSGMLDLGGGSLEIAVGMDRPMAAGSAQLGAARLLAEAPELAGSGLDDAFALAKARVLEVWERMSPGLGKPAAWVGVGGTLTCLAAVDMRMPLFDREAVDGYPLKRHAVEAWTRRLAAMPPAERAALPGMVPQRADIIAHGAVALWAAMDALGIARIVVSNRSNLDGYLQEIAGESARKDSVSVVRDFYDASVEVEWERLSKSFFEFEINRRYIDRYIKPGDRVLDVGGGPGRYSLHLASRGARVTLLDLSGGNVAFAAEKAREAGLPLETICGDARRVDELTEGAFDAILLMGPLYHLLEERDRVRAVESCLKRLKPGGVVFVSFISLVAGMIYAARSLPESILLENEDQFYEKLIAGEDFAGPAFTQAFFIAPEHILPFMERFPLSKLHLVISEGITAPFHLSRNDQPPEVLAKWLALSLALCEREDFYTYAEHFLYVGQMREQEGKEESQ